MQQKTCFKKLTCILLALALIIGLVPLGALNSYAANDFTDFSLGGDVKASYNATAKQLTITGSGTIEYAKWVEMARKFNSKFYVSSKEWSAGWRRGASEDFAIIFDGAADHSIKLCGTEKKKNGLFTNFSGDIQFKKQVDLAPNVTDLSDMFNSTPEFNQPISHWDVSNVTNMSHMFESADAFNGDIGSWNVSNVTNMSGMFEHAKAFNGDISGWDVSNVTDMSDMFRWNKAFNGDISAWNVSNVTNMSGMFEYAEAFNGDIGSWNVSNVTDMSAMFSWAKAFNGDISGWDVSNVTNMSHMFEHAKAFNGDISGWDVSNVTDMSHMFSRAYAFNGDIGGWNVSNVTDMSHMFEHAYAFNGDISAWNVSNVTNMSDMFWNADAFNGDIGGWNVSNVTDMSGMFEHAYAFNGDISAWNVSNVTNMSGMFAIAKAFNGDLSGWNVSNVTNMSHMFWNADAFNGDISGWNVSNVTDMGSMFDSADAFNGDISGWDVSKVTDMHYMFWGIKAFNGDISGWDTSNVLSMYRMFKNAVNYQQAIKLNISSIGIKGEPYDDLTRAFDNCATSSIILDAGTNVDIDAEDAFSATHNLSYLEFSGLKNAKIEGFGDDYIVKNITAGSEELKTKDESYTFIDNNHYIIKLQTPRKTPTLTANSLAKAYGNQITVADITGKSAKDGSKVVAGTWQFASEVSAFLKPGTHTITLKFVPDDTTTYKAALLDIKLTTYMDKSSLKHDGAGFKLHADSDTASNVVAKFADASETKLIISGHGQIDRAKWEEMVQTIKNNIYDFNISGWGYSQSFSIEFQSAAADHQIKLPANSNNLFCKFKNTIDFGKNNVDTSNVIDMTCMFKGAAAFNGDISGWNTSNVTDTYNMFDGAKAFNGDLSGWDVSKVTDMSHMFKNAYAFNGDLSGWNVSNARSTEDMFNGAAAFNSDIGAWDVSNVTDMHDMFNGAAAFNSDISGWNVSNVTNMHNMFNGAAAFNSDISNWNVSNVTNMDSMFEGATAFNGDISGWNVSNVTDMHNMFNGAAAFNSDISNWNVSNVTNMSLMFRNTANYQQAIKLNISALKEDATTSKIEGLSSTFEGCAAPSITLDAGANMDISAWSAFSDTQHLSYLEFNGLKNAKIEGFSGDYIVEDVATMKTVNKNKSNGYKFEDNTHYRVYLQGRKNIKACKIALIAPQPYSGNALKPSVTIIDTLRGSGYTLIEHKDYKLTYHNNTAIGTATVTISGIGDYYSDTSRHFEITDKNLITLTADDITKIDDGNAITLTDITGKSAKDGNKVVAGTWQLADYASNIIEPGVYTVALEFVPTDTTTYAEATINIVLTIKSQLDYSTAGFKLHADSDTTSNVIAKFTDASETKLIISGHGQIDRAKWIEMVQKIEKKANNFDYSGWNESKSTSIEFQSAAADHQIELPANSKNLFYKFNNNIDFGKNNVNTSNVTDMDSMFEGATAFNGDISGWNTSNVTDMHDMFNGAAAFNSDISNWDVSSVKNMGHMFQKATAFNGDISGWDVSNVTNMSAMFDGAATFNGDISNWNVSNVEDMYAMFSDAMAFNCDISSWNTSDVENMNYMFENTANYQQAIKLNISDIGGRSDFDGLVRAFRNCGAPSIRLDAGANVDIRTWETFSDTHHLSYLEFNGLKNAKIEGFSGDYIVEDVAAQTTVTNAFDAPFEFNDNLHYKVYLAQKNELNIEDVNRKYLIAKTTSDYLNLASLIPADAGAITINMATISGSNPAILATGENAPKLVGNTLNYQLSGKGVTGDTAILPLTISSDRYQTTSFNLVISLVETLKKQISDCTISSIPNQTYTGSEIEPPLTIRDGGYQLIEDAYYTADYTDNINVGTAKATITGKDLYEGTIKLAFQIVKQVTPKKHIGSCTINSIPDQTYTGSEIKPPLTITDGGHQLIENAYYTAVYTDNKAVGTAKVTITGKGLYEGTVTIAFQIVK